MSGVLVNPTTGVMGPQPPPGYQAPAPQILPNLSSVLSAAPAAEPAPEKSLYDQYVDLHRGGMNSFEAFEKVGMKKFGKNTWVDPQTGRGLHINPSDLDYADPGSIIEFFGWDRPEYRQEGLTKVTRVFDPNADPIRDRRSKEQIAYFDSIKSGMSHYLGQINTSWGDATDQQKLEAYDYGLREHGRKTQTRGDGFFSKALGFVKKLALGALPAIAGSVILPGVGTALGQTISSAAGGAIGGALAGGIQDGPLGALTGGVGGYGIGGKVGGLFEPSVAFTNPDALDFTGTLNLVNNPAASGLGDLGRWLYDPAIEALTTGTSLLPIASVNPQLFNYDGAWVLRHQDPLTGLIDPNQLDVNTLFEAGGGGGTFESLANAQQLANDVANYDELTGANDLQTLFSDQAILGKDNTSSWYRLFGDRPPPIPEESLVPGEMLYDLNPQTGVSVLTPGWDVPPGGVEHVAQAIAEANPENWTDFFTTAANLGLTAQQTYSFLSALNDPTYGQMGPFPPADFVQPERTLIPSLGSLPGAPTPVDPTYGQMGPFPPADYVPPEKTLIEPLNAPLQLSAGTPYGDDQIKIAQPFEPAPVYELPETIVPVRDPVPVVSADPTIGQMGPFPPADFVPPERIMIPTLGSLPAALTPVDAIADVTDPSTGSGETGTGSGADGGAGGGTDGSGSNGTSGDGTGTGGVDPLDVLNVMGGLLAMPNPLNTATSGKIKPKGLLELDPTNAIRWEDYLDLFDAA